MLSRHIGYLSSVVACFLVNVSFSVTKDSFEVDQIVTPDIVVALDGSGDYRSIQKALESIPDSNLERKIILIKDGLYNEVIKLEASCVTLRGESRSGTRIEAGAPSEDNNPGKPPTVVTVNGDDVVIENLTIQNTHGKIGVHAFAIAGRGDRTVILDADVLSHGNDTIALWRTDRGDPVADDGHGNFANGRYYHARLNVCGSVDFVCPRGWCYMKDSKLIAMNPKSEAIMWHDGSRNQDMKFVMVGCRFEGSEGNDFSLARHHHDAMFFFLNCSFANSMRDRPPFRVIYPVEGVPAAEQNKKRNEELDKTNIWGERTYFFNCHRDDADYPWHEDNLSKAPNAPPVEQLTAKWTFDNSWDPERIDGPEIVSMETRAGGEPVVTFSEPVTVKRKPRLVFPDGHYAEFVSGSGTNKIAFEPTSATESHSDPKLDLTAGEIIACEAGSTIRFVKAK